MAERANRVHRAPDSQFDAKQGRPHHRRGRQGPMYAGPGKPAVQSPAAELVVGLGHYVRLDLAGLAVRSLVIDVFSPVASEAGG